MIGDKGGDALVPRGRVDIGEDDEHARVRGVGDPGLLARDGVVRAVGGELGLGDNTTSRDL